MDLVKRWIGACHEHPICQMNYSPDKEAFRPTRLLAVGKPSEPTIRLVEDPELPSGPLQYVALSHCWGTTTMPMTLLTRNIDTMKTSISVRDLSKNFQDTITIARGIGVPYVWIDSLCIIQDSPNKIDWEKESVRMGLVYAHAVCTVSATASADSRGGCFYTKRKFKHPSTCVLGRKRFYGKNISLVAQLDNSEDTSLSELFDTYVEQAPLTTRGWTFQERVLSRRIVHYCDGFVLFECNTVRASEYHVTGVHYAGKPHLLADGTFRSPEEYARLMTTDDFLILGSRPAGRVAANGGGAIYPIYAAMKPALVPNPDYKTPDQKRTDFLRTAALMGMRGEFQLLLTAKSKTEEEKAEFHNGWYEIVGRYAVRKLTVESDKVMAIAGIANFIQKSVGRTFVAGAWEEVIGLNLLWNVQAGRLTSRPSCSAPTWSWISVNGGVETKLRSLFKAAPHPDITYLVSDIEKTDVLQHEDCIINAKLTLKGRFYDIITTSINFIPDVRDTGFEQPNRRLDCLPILLLSWKPSEGHTVECHRQIHGIVLRKSYLFNEYERVGYFWTEDEDTISIIQSSQVLEKSIVLC